MSAHVISAIGGDVPDHAKVTRALLSVSDKTGLVELGRPLSRWASSCCPREALP